MNECRIWFLRWLSSFIKIRVINLHILHEIFSTFCIFWFLWWLLSFIIIRVIKRGRLFDFAKLSSPPPPPPLHYVLPWIAPSLYKLFFSFLAHIYLRHMSHDQKQFFQVHLLIIAFQKKLLIAGAVIWQTPSSYQNLELITFWKRCVKFMATPHLCS